MAEAQPEASSAGTGRLGSVFVILASPPTPGVLSRLRVIFYNYNIMGILFPQDLLGSWINNGEYSYLEVWLFLWDPVPFFVQPSTQAATWDPQAVVVNRQAYAGGSNRKHRLQKPLE